MQHVDSVLTKFSISSSGLREWSDQITNDWRSKNAHSLVRGDESVIVEALQSQLKHYAFEVAKLKDQGRDIKKQLETIIKQQSAINDMISDLLLHGGVHSPPRKSVQHYTEITAPSVAKPIEQVAATSSLKKHDNTSLYHLNSLSGVTLCSALTNWVKYQLNKNSKKGMGFSLNSNKEHITKFKFVVLFALKKANEVAPESLISLTEKEPKESDPAHAAWLCNISNAAKTIEAEVIKFILQKKEEYESSEENKAKSQKRKRGGSNDVITINKLKEMIEMLKLN